MRAKSNIWSVDVQHDYVRYGLPAQDMPRTSASLLISTVAAKGSPHDAIRKVDALLASRSGRRRFPSALIVGVKLVGTIEA